MKGLKQKTEENEQTQGFFLTKVVMCQRKQRHGVKPPTGATGLLSKLNSLKMIYFVSSSLYISAAEELGSRERLEDG